MFQYHEVFNHQIFKNPWEQIQQTVKTTYVPDQALCDFIIIFFTFPENQRKT